MDDDLDFTYIEASEVTKWQVCLNNNCSVEVLVVTLKFDLPCNKPKIHLDYKVVNDLGSYSEVSAVVNRCKGVSCNSYVFINKQIILEEHIDIDIFFTSNN